MGLDNFFMKECAPGEQAPEVIIDPPANLCGKLIFKGDSSFRGKVYDDFVVRVTDVSLYEDHTRPDTVIEMADSIAEWISANPGKHFQNQEYDWTIEHAEIIDLERVFRIHGEAGFSLVSWY
tara:strand:- start:1610 stop:1975 length:366 start_codon:yes stop_codon:yes gene_type:complete